jgi:hypothetical protein
MPPSGRARILGSGRYHLLELHRALVDVDVGPGTVERQHRDGGRFQLNGGAREHRHERVQFGIVPHEQHGAGFRRDIANHVQQHRDRLTVQARVLTNRWLVPEFCGSQLPGLPCPQCRRAHHQIEGRHLIA